MLTYLLNGIRHYRRINVVVMLAVAISTSVIGGSLIVGDSVRYSLRQMTQQRLGRISELLHSPRFFRQALTAEVATAYADEKRNLATISTREPVDLPSERSIAPAMLVTGSVERDQDNDRIRRAGSVSLLALDESGWEFLDTADVAHPVDREVVLGYRTATEIRASVGDEVSVWVEVPSSIPRDSLLGERDEVNVEMVLTVSGILPETAGASRFDMNPGQQLPYNAFLPLLTLQERLGLEEIVPSRRDPTAKPARINTILVARNDEESSAGLMPSMTATEILNDSLQSTLTIQDAGLRLRIVPGRGYVSAETDRMILDDTLATAVTNAAQNLGLNSAPTLVYLSNEITAEDRQEDDERFSMYSIICALPYNSPAPLGPFRLNDQSAVPALADDDILLSAWLAKDLAVVVGDTVRMKWHEVGSHGELPEIEKSFTVKGVLPEEDAISVDIDLTPYVEGVTDVDSFGDIDQPFEMDLDALSDRDNEYWEEHRATPKAFVSLKTAQQLWKSRYGKFTSIRMASADGQILTEDQLNRVVERLAFEVPRQLEPARVGFAFRPILAEGLQAAVGANDFTVLFLGFSFFLILSAIILASLMFRLGLQQRINQLGLLNAVGWPSGRIRNLFLGEGLIVCAAGAILGTVGALFFARLMIYGLTTWWAGAVGTQFLLLDIQPLKLVLAAGLSLFFAGTVIGLALRAFRTIEIREQLAGNAEQSETGTAARNRRSGMYRLLKTFCLITAIALPAIVSANLVPADEAFGGLSWPMVCFFLAGFAGLTWGLLALNVTLQRRVESQTSGGQLSGLTGLAIANAARSPMRSMLTTALIAFATFVIVAVAAGRRNPLSEIPDINSGNGGFSLVAESAQPVLFDLNTAEGRNRLGLIDGNVLPDGVTVYPFSMKPGSDASCVNLYQTRVPTILGASDAFIERGGFRFADTDSEEWKLLKTAVSMHDGLPVYPVIGDMNTLKYSLKKSINDYILIPDETEPVAALQVVGMLDGSVFQGVVVTTDENLKRIDGDIAGARYFLAETPDSAAMETTAETLESVLNDYGLDSEPVSERLAGFLAVQNTYLSTFQMLGGLGLLVGTFGLAAVMMRNVVERRREIALMRALGFTKLRITRLILSENCVLLLWGIALGTGSALLAMLPHLRSTGADLPWPMLSITLAAVVGFGSLASVFAVRAATTLSVRDNLAAE